MDKGTKISLYWHTKMSAGTDFNEQRMEGRELVRYAYENGYSAIGITDRYTLQAFPEVFCEWERLRKEHSDECEVNGFLKIIYGMEGMLVTGEGEEKTVLIYVLNERGMRNLYKLVTDSYLKYFDKIPTIPATLLEKYKEGLFILDDPDELSSVQEEIVKRAEYVSPLRQGKYYPLYPEAEEKLKRICEERTKELFGNDIPAEIKNRMEKELKAICVNGYADIYMIWHDLTALSADRGYTTVLRGCAGSSLIAYLCGITGVNPLPAAYGGYDIPAETFMGLKFDKEPDIDINFAPAIQGFIQEQVAGLPGVGETCYCGTIAVYKEMKARICVTEYYIKNDLPLPDEEIIQQQTQALCGVRRADGCHPGGVIVCPEGEELVSFTPLQHPWNRERISTHFEYHYLTDELLKLDILGYIPLDLLHEMQELTGKAIDKIPLEDKKTLEFLCDPEIEAIDDLPEFGSEYARRMIKESGPKTFEDLIKIDGLMHGTDVWWDVQRDMVISGKMLLKDCISTRDDIFMFLSGKGMDGSDAYEIMESVRKGRGLTDRMQHKMMLAGIREDYINVCKKIRYLFPRSHAVSYTLTAWRLAYYMIYYPSEFKEALAAAG